MQVLTHQKRPEENLKIVYTSTSWHLYKSHSRRSFKKQDIPDVNIVAGTSFEPNGNFPTVKSPNPEEPEALSRWQWNLAEKING